MQITPNDVLRFVLELFAFFSLGWWGFSQNVVLGVLAPAVGIALWALFRAPRAAIRVAMPWRIVVEVIVFGAAAAGWFLVGQPMIGSVFAVVALISGILSGRKEARA